MRFTSRRAWVESLLFACVLAAFFSVTAHAQTKPAAVPPTSTPTPAEFRTVLEGYRGQVVILNVWATWCVPCLREIPDLLALQADFVDRGVVLIGVAVDEPTPAAAEVERFRKRYFPTFLTYARSGSELDELTRVIDPSWNEVVPTTYLIGRDGRIKQRIQGKRSLEQFRVALQSVL